MPFSAGDKLGPYQILAPIGSGGMGAVYRARDTRLNRDVAVKVLHTDGAASADLRSRFEREARAVAALNHPNVVAIYDFGVEAGQQYIVSELIEGEPLRAILTGKPVPVRKLLDIATQVADGLSAAHAAGIIHRDLKPENIMLTKDGRAKIVDFGLARHLTSVRSDPPSAQPSGSETTGLHEPEGASYITGEGVVMGTARYMSPEQATGKPVDYRTDQFSLGLIFYEMASGKQAFARPSAVETMAAIVRDDPPPMDEKQPAPLRWIIDHCLAKEPEQRYDSTRDLSRELRILRDHFSEAYATTSLAPVVRQKSLRSWVLPIALGIGGLLLGLLLVFLLSPLQQDAGNFRYTPFARGADNLIWSSDGKTVTYSSAVDGIDQVFLRYLNSPAPVQLTHSKNGVVPLGWSTDPFHLVVVETPDAKESPFQKLYKLDLVGGSLNFIMDVDCSVCDVSRDGNALATLAQGKNPGDMYSVSISDPLGSPLRPYLPAPFATKEINEVPQLAFSPDGKKILLFLAGENLQEEAWLLPYPAGGKPPQRVLQMLPVLRGTPTFSWMPDNRHIVVELRAYLWSPTHLWLADTESNDLTPVTTGNASERAPAVAPDGKSLIYIQTTPSYDVVSVAVNDGFTKTLVATGRQESMAAWSRNAEKLIWVTNRSGPVEIWALSADQTQRPVVTATDFPDGSRWLMNPALSPAGDRVIFTEVSVAGVARLWIKSLGGESHVRLTNVEPSSEFGGAWSPDGSRYVYLQTLAGSISLMTVKTSGNAAPAELKKNVQYYLPDWSPAGDWITFRDDKGWNMISPDGKASKFLGKIETDALAFSKDGKLLYGVQNGEYVEDRDRATFFSLDPATLKQKSIRELGKDLRPSSNVSPGIRLSLAPDGKSFAYTTEKTSNDLWMLQGYRQPGWLNRISSLWR